MRRKKTQGSRARRPMLVASGLAAAGALIGAAVLRRRSRDGTPDGPAGRARENGGDTRREWQCECGQVLLISGEGRHRVFWLPDAPLDDPLLDGTCPNCERSLTRT
jgi:hypothetical protein